MLQDGSMKTYIFRVVVEPDEDRWIAYCPLLQSQGGATWGESEDEALRNIQEVALRICLERRDPFRRQPPSLEPNPAPCDPYPEFELGALERLDMAGGDAGVALAFDELGQCGEALPEGPSDEVSVFTEPNVAVTI